MMNWGGVRGWRTRGGDPCLMNWGGVRGGGDHCSMKWSGIRRWMMR